MKIDQFLAICMPCSHCYKPARYFSRDGDATDKPKYCDDHVPWKDEIESGDVCYCDVCWNEQVACTCMGEDE